MTMKFSRPTIKANGRAYARLYTEYLKTPEAWATFLSCYRIEHIPHGLSKNGDCAVRVVDPATGQLANLGLEIPCELKYHEFLEPSRQFWNEIFLTEIAKRTRVTEIGRGVTKDEVLPRSLA